MKSFTKLTLCFALIYASCLHASDPKFEIPDVKDDSGLVVQTLVFLSEKDFQEKIPEQMKPLMQLPAIKQTIIKPEDVFAFPIFGIEQKFYPVAMNSYAVLEAEHFHTIPHILTSDLCECVGLSFYVPNVKAGVMHVGFKSVDQGLLDQYIALFSTYDKANVTVRVMSTYYSILLQEVCAKLQTAGFDKIESDIIPIYLDCQNRTSSGTKYYNYQDLGFSLQEAHALSEKSIAEIEENINILAGLNMNYTESRRLMMLDARDGSSCLFFPKGNAEANSMLVHLFYKIIFNLNMIRPGTVHKPLFDRMVQPFIDKFQAIAKETVKAAEDYKSSKNALK